MGKVEVWGRDDGKDCDRILCELQISDGRVRKICDKCGTVNVFQARPPVSYEELLRHLLNMQAASAPRGELEPLSNIQNGIHQDA